MIKPCTTINKTNRKPYHYPKTHMQQERKYDEGNILLRVHVFDHLNIKQSVQNN